PEGCSSLLGLAEQVLQKESTTSNSRLTVLVIGDGSSANEPSRLVSYAIPKTRKAMEGRNAAQRQQQYLLADLLQKCQAMRSTTVSPIFLAIIEALADLHAEGCNENSGCRLFIDSDGEENVNEGIRQALSKASRSHPSLPTPIDNNGVGVTFCGLAVTARG